MTFVYLSLAAAFALGVLATLITQAWIADRRDRRAHKLGNARVVNTTMLALDRQRRLSQRRPHDVLDPRRKHTIRTVR